jgi:hypothetical protein
MIVPAAVPCTISDAGLLPNTRYKQMLARLRRKLRGRVRSSRLRVIGIAIEIDAVGQAME